MRPIPLKTKLTRAVLGLAVAATIAAPAAYAQPSTIAGSVGMEYGDLRARDAQDATVASRQVVVEPSDRSGFDWPSAAIGAVGMAGLSVALIAALGKRRTVGRRTAGA
jgi:hypothetical protein